MRTYIGSLIGDALNRAVNMFFMLPDRKAEDVAEFVATISQARDIIMRIESRRESNRIPKAFTENPP
jgi:hypothetical protein